MTHAEINWSANRAILGNDRLELEVMFAGGLRLGRLVNKQTGTQWIPAPPDYEWGTDDFHCTLQIGGRAELWPDLAPPSREFLLHYTPVKTDQSLDPTERAGSKDHLKRVELTGATPCAIVPDRCRAEVQGNSARLDLTVSLTDHPLEITVHSEVYAGLPILRRWTTVTNRAENPVLVHKLLSLMLSVRPSDSDLDLYWVEVFKHEQFLWRQATVHQERITTAVRRKLLAGPYSRPHDGSNGSMAWLALRDPKLNEGLFIGWEWTGLFDAEVGDFREGAGVFGLQAGFSDEGDYARTLKPGESFTTPKAFCGFFQGDVEEAGRATRKVAEKLFVLPWPEQKAPMFIGYDTWNNWQDFKGITRHLNPARLDREIELAAGLGVELFILDYDWFPRLGDWWSDPDRFPNGVEAVSARVKAAGMKFGIWMGFGQVDKESQVAREHPEWLVIQNGKPLVQGWSSPSLCLGYPPCRDWVLEQVSRVVETFGADWLKHDFDLIPISQAHHHAPGATDSRIETILGYYYIMEKLHERFPRLYLDNWTPATGGADFGNFQRHHSTLMADWYSAITVRSSLNGISHLIAPERTHCYLRIFSKADEKDPYYHRSGFFGNGLYLLNDILPWDEETIRVARDQIGLIKEDRALFRGGEIYTLIPKQPDHFGWEARIVYSAEAGRGMAQVFRNHDPAGERQIAFKGLDPDQRYRVEWIDQGRREESTGASLMDRGITVRLDKPFSSEWIRLFKTV